jgi:hypothetical protein
VSRSSTNARRERVTRNKRFDWVKTLAYFMAAEDQAQHSSKANAGSARNFSAFVRWYGSSIRRHKNDDAW